MGKEVDHNHHHHHHHHHNPCIPDFEHHPHDYKPYVTKYFGFPLWRANDTTSWLTGINKAMIEIDEALHQFALRTGVDGLPDETIEAVSRLEKTVENLALENEKNVRTLSEMTKVTANILAEIELINTKLRVLNTNYANVDTRLKSVETGSSGNESQVEKLLENVTAISDKLSSLTATVEDIKKRVEVLEGDE